VRELIAELGRDHTVVLSTHILPEVEQVCERVLIIDRGVIVADGTPADLQARLVGNPALRVELRGADGQALEPLEAIPGVVGVARTGDGRYRVEHQSDVDPREAIFHLAVEKGWVLAELAAERTSLEDVFVRLTTREEATPTGEPPAWEPETVAEEV